MIVSNLQQMYAIIINLYKLLYQHMWMAVSYLFVWIWQVEY